MPGHEFDPETLPWLDRSDFPLRLRTLEDQGRVTADEVVCWRSGSATRPAVHERNGGRVYLRRRPGPIGKMRSAVGSRLRQLRKDA